VAGRSRVALAASLTRLSLELDLAEKAAHAKEQAHPEAAAPSPSTTPMASPASSAGSGAEGGRPSTSGAKPASVVRGSRPRGSSPTSSIPVNGPGF
jgi:hypothetical protein